MEQVARMILVVAVAMQMALWGWHYLEKFGLSWLASRPKWPKAVFFVLATLGALFNVLIARGLIHWARTADIAEPLTRRMIVSFFLLCVVAFGFFRSRNVEWLQSANIPVYWRAKSFALAIAVPVFLLSVIPVPLHGDTLSVAIASGCAWIVDVPVIGLVIGICATVQLVVSTLASAAGLLFLRSA